MAEWRLFPEGTIPEYTTWQWYEGRERAPHLEQPGHRERLLLTAHFVDWVGTAYDVTTVSDLGCGDGGLLSLLKSRGFTAWGYDVSPAAVEGARERGVDAELLDVVAGVPRIGDIAVCTEMLEHLVDPHAYVRQLLDWGADYVVASSPWNESGDSHYEFHTWAWDRNGYPEMFECNGWKVIRHEDVHGFQVIAARRA